LETKKPNALSDKPQKSSPRIKQKNSYSKQQIGWVNIIRESNIEVQTISKVLIERIKKLPNVNSKPSGENYVFRRGRNYPSQFAVFMPRKRTLAIRLRTNSTNYPDRQGLVRKKIYNWFFYDGSGIEREFKISKKEQVDYAFELIKSSYELMKPNKRPVAEEELNGASEIAKLDMEQRQYYREYISSPFFERNYCCYCGRPLEAGWNFCGSCGKKIP
jgi:hypothetical protein